MKIIKPDNFDVELIDEENGVYGVYNKATDLFETDKSGRVFSGTRFEMAEQCKIIQSQILEPLEDE